MGFDQRKKEKEDAVSFASLDDTHSEKEISATLSPPLPFHFIFFAFVRAS